MDVFISWSGNRSKEIAQALRDWLPNVIQAVDPWMSDEDIEKGARWGPEMAGKLESSKVGIICLTPENLKAPWVLFEAGALSKTLERTYVCPYIMELTPSQIEPPLGTFQATVTDREDTRNLLHTINGALDDSALAVSRLDKLFDVLWPELKVVIDRVQNLSVEDKPVVPIRSTDEMLEEVLSLLRSQARTLGEVSGTQQLIMTQTALSDLGVPLGELSLDQFLAHWQSSSSAARALTEARRKYLPSEAEGSAGDQPSGE